MAKPSKKIDPKMVLADIRGGMTDSDLMKNYNLSPVGLQSLLKKMGQLGLVGIISARDFLRDIRMGMSDVDLMAKYELSAKSLGSVFEQMENAGISIGLEKSLAAGSKNTIRINEVVRDIRSGLTKQELMEKYRLTPRGLIWVSMKLISTGAISGQEIYGKLCSSYQELVLTRHEGLKGAPHIFTCQFMLVVSRRLLGASVMFRNMVSALEVFKLRSARQRRWLSLGTISESWARSFSMPDVFGGATIRRKNISRDLKLLMLRLGAGKSFSS